MTQTATPMTSQDVEEITRASLKKYAFFKMEENKETPRDIDNLKESARAFKLMLNDKVEKLEKSPLEKDKKFLNMLIAMTAEHILRANKCNPIELNELNKIFNNIKIYSKYLKNLNINVDKLKNVNYTDANLFLKISKINTKFYLINTTKTKTKK